jgi:hypothetical protein
MGMGVLYGLPIRLMTIRSVDEQPIISPLGQWCRSHGPLVPIDLENTDIAGHSAFRIR